MCCDPQDTGSAEILQSDGRVCYGFNEPVPCLFLDRSFNSHRHPVRLCIIRDLSYVDPGAYRSRISILSHY